MLLLLSMISGSTTSSYSSSTPQLISFSSISSFFSISYFSSILTSFFFIISSILLHTSQAPYMNSPVFASFSPKHFSSPCLNLNTVHFYLFIFSSSFHLTPLPPLHTLFFSLDPPLVLLQLHPRPPPQQLLLTSLPPSLLLFLLSWEPGCVRSQASGSSQVCQPSTSSSSSAARCSIRHPSTNTSNQCTLATGVSDIPGTPGILVVPGVKQDNHTVLCHSISTKANSSAC